MYTLEKARDEQETLLKEAVDAVCEDEFVNEPSFAKAPPVKDFASKCTEALHSNIAVFVLQFNTILQLLWPVVAAADKHSTLSARQEASYRAFFSLRQRADFHQAIKDLFINNIPDAMAIPHMFVQVFARYLFEKLFLRHEYVDPKPTATISAELSTKEKNALRYVAGYVTHKMPRKVQYKKESEGMRQVLQAMKRDATKDTRLNFTREWVEAQSRGGLTLVNDGTFLFFEQIEQIVRKSFPSEAAQLKRMDIRTTIPERVLSDRIIIDKWAVLCSAADDLSEHGSLIMLQLVVDFYVQIRAFSFARNIMERYKIQQKSLQKKSKGLRGDMKRAGETQTTS